MIITAMPNNAIMKKIKAVSIAWPHLVVSIQSASMWLAHRQAWGVVV
jgi:hypothetical protein